MDTIFLDMALIVKRVVILIVFANSIHTAVFIRKRVVALLRNLAFMLATKANTFHVLYQLWPILPLYGNFPLFIAYILHLGTSDTFYTFSWWPRRPEMPITPTERKFCLICCTKSGFRIPNPCESLHAHNSQPSSNTTHASALAVISYKTTLAEPLESIYVFRKSWNKERRNSQQSVLTGSLSK